jgi:hypothetical protein
VGIYCGPAYEDKGEKWKYRDYSWDSSRLVAIDQDLDKFAEGLKARVLSLGDEKHLIPPQWGQEMQAELQLQGFTSTIEPKEGIVKFSHPGGLKGSLALIPHGSWYDFSQKCRDSDFPNDILIEKEVLLACNLLNDQKSKFIKYDNNPHEIARAIAKLAEKYVQVNRTLPLVYREVCHAWKSDILVPKLNGDSLQLVNTKLKGDDSIILELTPEKDKLVLKDKKDYYEISDDPREIAQTIADLAEKHVQEFIQANGIKLTNTRVVEIDF